MTVRIAEAHRKGSRRRRLVTDLLDAEAYPAQEIVAVYDQHWRIETFYREIKHVMRLEQWHARTVHSFVCELLFAMILATLLADVRPACRQAGRTSAREVESEQLRGRPACRQAGLAM